MEWPVRPRGSEGVVGSRQAFPFSVGALCRESTSGSAFVQPFTRTESWPVRPRRSAAERRQQRLRAEARVVQRLLKGFAQLHDHRGCRTTLLGSALAQALQLPHRATPFTPQPRFGTSSVLHQNTVPVSGINCGEQTPPHAPFMADCMDDPLVWRHPCEERQDQVGHCQVESTSVLPDLAGEWQPHPPSHCTTPRALECPTAVCDVPADAPGPSTSERSTLRFGKGSGIVSEPHPPGTDRSHSETHFSRCRNEKDKAGYRIWVLRRHSMPHMTANLISFSDGLLAKRPG